MCDVIDISQIATIIGNGKVRQLRIHVRFEFLANDISYQVIYKILIVFAKLLKFGDIRCVAELFIGNYPFYIYSGTYVSIQDNYTTEMVYLNSELFVDEISFWQPKV